MKKINLIRLADIKAYIGLLDKEEITLSKFAEILNDCANESLSIYNINSLDYDISITKEFCKTDLAMAYQAGALDMYNEMINTVNEQKLNVLKNKYYEWFKLQHG